MNSRSWLLSLSVLISLLVILGSAVSAAPKEWTRGARSTTANQAGVDGTKDVPATDIMPGARDGSISWLTGTGGLWHFGGYGYDSAGTLGYLNDLWVYSLNTDQWTWVSGSSAANRAGVYGTMGAAAAGNAPGARKGSISWLTGTGGLWLFGGYGYDSTGTLGYLNDLWVYSLNKDQWTWVAGPNTANQAGVYGTKSISAADNVPGARKGSISWLTGTGGLWLFGGYSYDSTGTLGYLNDLWVYSLNTDKWTWVSGSNTVNQAGIYEGQGEEASFYLPLVNKDR